jgi:type II restriction enzyme
MRDAIRHGDTPHFFLLSYELDSMLVRDLFCIPDFALTESALEKRKPLALTARRAGWVGCNILLDHVPSDARIPIVKENRPASPAEVRRAYKRLKPLASLKLENRGWTLDVLNVVRSLDKSEFDLQEIYASEASLLRLHPKNLHVRPKIRQQLQVLRDLGLLEFLGSGTYRLR